MRRRALASLCAGAIVLACSSSTQVTPAPDAGSGATQALGEPCAPTKPCAQPTDGCSVAVCDATSHLCVRVVVDGGPTCSGGNAPASCASAACDAAADATDAAGDADAAAADAMDAGSLDGSIDATSEGGDASLDAGADAGDATDSGSD